MIVPAGTAKVGFRVNRKGTRWWSGYYGNVAIDQVVLECGGGPPAPPAPPPALCTQDCPPYPHYAGDGECDDGGSESSYSLCPLGSDCQVRAATQIFCPQHAPRRGSPPTPPPPPPHPHPSQSSRIAVLVGSRHRAISKWIWCAARLPNVCVASPPKMVVTPVGPCLVCRRCSSSTRAAACGAFTISSRSLRRAWCASS